MCNYFSDYKITNSNNIDKLKVIAFIVFCAT